jgi:hypothetical protein
VHRGRGGQPAAGVRASVDWHRITLKQQLFTLVYNERGKLGKIYRSKRAGLTVATPSKGTYFQFDGQYSEVDITDRDPQRVADAVGVTYRRSPMLNDGTYQKIEPLLLVRYEPGVELIIKDVRVEPDRVRVFFIKDAPDADPDIATSLTIKWPVPFSSGLSERPNIEALILDFVSAAPS